MTEFIRLDFSLLFFHSDDDTLADEKAKRILVESIFTCDPSVVAVTHALRLIDHRLVSSEQNESRRRDLLLLLAMVMSRLKSSDISDWKAVQQFVFQLECFRECTREPLSGPILQGLSIVLLCSFVSLIYYPYFSLPGCHQRDSRPHRYRAEDITIGICQSVGPNAWGRLGFPHRRTSSDGCHLATIHEYRSIDCAFGPLL